MLMKKYDLIVDEKDHDYCDVANLPVVSEFQNAVTEYISGYAVKMATKSVKCEECVFAMSENHINTEVHMNIYALIFLKSKLN